MFISDRDDKTFAVSMRAQEATHFTNSFLLSETRVFPGVVISYYAMRILDCEGID